MNSVNWLHLQSVQSIEKHAKKRSTRDAEISVDIIKSFEKYLIQAILYIFNPKKLSKQVKNLNVILWENIYVLEAVDRDLGGEIAK